MIRDTVIALIEPIERQTATELRDSAEKAPSMRDFLREVTFCANMPPPQMPNNQHNRQSAPRFPDPPNLENQEI